MSETIYGNQVIYITCKSSQINSIPIKDGQLIVLMDSDGMFYDMGSVRHQLNGFKIVKSKTDLPSQLPSPDVVTVNSYIY